MPIRRVFLTAALAALGSFFAAGSSPASPAANGSAAPKAGVAASPIVPEAVVAPDPVLPASGRDGSWEAGDVDDRPETPDLSHPSKTATASVLIEAHVLEKYRSFRESLSAP